LKWAECAEDGSEVSLADRDSELLVFQAVYKAGLGPKFYGRWWHSPVRSLGRCGV
jgi:hypothetical protein